MRSILSSIVVVLVALGCSRSPDSAVPGAGASSSVGGEVIAVVNGVSLTQSEIDLEVKFRMAALKPQPEGERLVQARTKMQSAVVEQFVVRTLLLGEAEKAGITASSEERDEAIEKIRGNLPPGQTLEAMVAASPLGEAGLMDEITTGIKINKLLETGLADKLAVSDEDIDAFIEENKDRLQRPERVRASHILIAGKPTDDDAVKEAGKVELEKIRQQLVDGGDFAALAGKHSVCPSGKRSGGDLGLFGRGRMDKVFEDAAFNQEIGAIGPVIETQFGYHIVQVTEKEPAGIATREEVTQMLKQRKQQVAIREYVEELKRKADITVQGATIPGL